MKNSNNESLSQQLPKNNIPGFEVLFLSEIYGSEETSVTVKFENPNCDLHRTMTIPMRDIRSASKLRKIIPYDFSIEGIPVSRQTEKIQDEINRVLSSGAIEKQVTLPQGFSHIGSQWRYVLGDMVLPSADMLKPNRKGQYHFTAHNPENLSVNEGFPQHSAEEMFSWCKRYCSQGHAQAVLFLCSLTPLLRCVLDTDCAVNAFVIGKSGVGKTEQIKLVSRLTEHYGVSLENDTRQINRFFARFGYDRSYLVDDLNLTDSSSHEDKKKTRLSELLQKSCAAGDMYSDEYNMDFSRVALLISAEVVLRNPSSINRCLLLKIEQAFDPPILTYFQENQYLFVRFWIKFVSWLCSGNERLKNIQTFYNQGVFQIAGTDKPEAYIGFARVYRHFRIVLTMAHAVDQFFAALGVEERLLEIFQAGINKCVFDTLEEIRDTGSAALKAKLAEFEESREKLTFEINRLEMEVQGEQYSESQIRVLFQSAENQLRNGTLANRRAVIDQYVEKVVIHPEKIEVYLKVMGDYERKETINIK